MWESLVQFLAAHKKGVGVFGDSITFAGSLVLSLEALCKKTERISTERKKKLLERTPYLKSKTGENVSVEMIENKWDALWTLLAKWGIVILTAGFLVLLLGRLFTE